MSDALTQFLKWLGTELWYAAAWVFLIEALICVILGALWANVAVLAKEDKEYGRVFVHGILAFFAFATALFLVLFSAYTAGYIPDWVPLPL